jgi:predicted GNAT family N-acyltransferase
LEEFKGFGAKSQTQSQQFYEKNGFKTVKGPYEEYGVEHVDMNYEG